MTSAFIASATPQLGVVYGAVSTSQAFIVGDRGCMPSFSSLVNPGVAAPGVSQSLLTPMIFGSTASSTLGGLLNDLFAIRNNLCNLYGKCCTKPVCNK